MRLGVLPHDVLEGFLGGVNGCGRLGVERSYCAKTTC